MASTKRIKLMISSRCSDSLDFRGKPTTLSEVRKALKESLLQEQIAGSPLLEVWINEDAPPAEGDSDAWETCMQQVREADIVLVLFNGVAGWAKEAGDVGICHAEFATALATAPAKVRVLELPIVQSKKKVPDKRDQRFRDYYWSQGRFRGKQVTTGEELIEEAKRTLHDAVVDMTKLGVREARKGKFDTGTALDWSRLDFRSRQQVMIDVVQKAIAARTGSVKENKAIIVRVADVPIVVACNAIPGPFNLSAARELVGQPFLKDHLLGRHLSSNRGGPVHLIACHRSITEPQALNMLGMPDVTVVTTPFGVFAADNVHNIQLLLISNCRDETSTRTGIQRAFEWLEQSGEDSLLGERALKRARIVQAIAKEQAS